jgi:putative N6-adenine-specific DNA methylase
VDPWASFAQAAISDLEAPEVAPGLVMVNPPYGGRIGNKKALYGLYAALGKRLAEGFGGWRLGLITAEPALARATGLSFRETGPPVPNGGLQVRLYQADL